jgi:hypothetical protein
MLWTASKWKVSFELRRLFARRKSCRYLLNGKLGGPQTCAGNRTQKGPAGILWYSIMFLYANVFLKYLWSYSCWYSRKFRSLKMKTIRYLEMLTADAVSCPRSTECLTTPLIKPKKIAYNDLLVENFLLRDRWLSRRLNLILPSFGLLRGVRWF